MNQGRTVFAQLISFLSHKKFNRCVARYEGNKSVRSFSCWDQFLTMAFAQLTYRESLRDIEVCLAAQQHKLYHSGFSGPVKRSTLADANETRDWRIYRDFAQSLIQIARPLYAHSELGLELDATAYAFDATTIDLCLSLFPWAQFRNHKSAIKLHTLLEIHSAIPVFIAITAAQCPRSQPARRTRSGTRLIHRHGSRFPRLPAALSIANRTRVLCHSHQKQSALSPSLLPSARPRYWGAQRSNHYLNGPQTSTLYPLALRRVHYYSAETDQRLVLLTNNFSIPALTVAALYRYRWQIELFFKWIKQHLRIKSFFGTSDNSVKTQVWIAVTVYVLVAIVKKRLSLKHDLYTLLQILSLTLFEKTPILSLLQQAQYNLEMDHDVNQLQLLDI